jgi:hypothetical protein
MLLNPTENKLDLSQYNPDFIVTTASPRLGLQLP